MDAESSQPAAGVGAVRVRLTTGAGLAEAEARLLVRRKPFKLHMPIQKKAPKEKIL